MGLYDRDYSREPESGYQLAAPQSATMQLLVVTVGVYLLQLVFPAVTENLRLYDDWWRQPWQFYQLLTYGFLHDPVTSKSIEPIGHIVINMFVLWMFGRELEAKYGRTEFMAFYLLAIVIAGLGWSLIESVAAPGTPAAMLGASGGVSAAVALFALNYPHRQVLVMFVIPMPMWVAAVGGLMYDAFGAVNRSESNVAFTAHLAGAAFGLAYYRFNWRLAPWTSSVRTWIKRRSGPKLRVVGEMDGDDEGDDLSQQVDAILEKIQAKGQDSLTRNERKILEKASRQYQQKRK